MIFQLLTLRRRRTEQSPSGKDKVFSLIIQLFINKKILLLCTDCRNNTLSLGIAEKSDKPQALITHKLNRLQQRCFFIQHLTRIRAKHRRNTKRIVLYKRI